MKATVLVDNIAYNGIAGEWGLSIFIETDSSKILLDVGETDLFIKNAQKLGINIEEADYAVLSHAHYDHSGGMKEFFLNNSKAQFYLRESPRCYFKKFIFHKYIGTPQDVIAQYSDRIRFVSGNTELCDGVYLIAHNTPELEEIGKREMMYLKTDSGWQADNFSHEQSLVIDTKNGLVIFNSCSHGGAVNIINEVAAVFPEKNIYGLVGGFHLYNKSKKEVRELADKIRHTGIQYVCTGHCTKQRAYKIMKNELGDILRQLHVGLEMDFQ